MKKKKGTKEKRVAAWLCIFSMLVSLCVNPQLVYAEENDKSGTVSGTEETMAYYQQEAAGWILSKISEEGNFGDAQIINDTCMVAALMKNTGLDVPETSTEWIWEKVNRMESNHDILARTYMATGNGKLLSELLEGQNPDGGFGLNQVYKSDALDSILALESLAADMAEGVCHEKETALLLVYLTKIQNQDGGFGYTADSGSSYELSIKAALAAAAYEAHGSRAFEGEWREALESYIRENMPSYETCSAGNTEYMLYKALTGDIDLEEGMTWIRGHQEENGSFSNDLTTTVYAVYFMEVLEKQNQPYFYAGDMSTLLSSYVLYNGFETEITAETTFGYKTNRQQTGRLKVTCIQDGEAVPGPEQEIVLQPEKQQAVFRITVPVTAEAESDYVLRVELYVDETPVGMTEDNLKVQEVSVEKLVLKLQGADTDGVSLSWNDISNEYYKYGYRIYRQTEDGDWETRSSWDGEEKVRVLNIYPTSWAEKHLKNWMETTVSGEAVPAGKGLFLIDTVLIDDYNRNPDQYLFDEEGCYKYDVLYFGAADTNAYKDLNEQSYTATLKFAESGRGILFGHDTVTVSSIVYHPYFGRFGEMMGIVLKNGRRVDPVNKVRVINTGFLTCYPWKIDGVLTIPSTHALEQYTGGTASATVWMEFVSGGDYDAETGASANAYLFSRNNLAMIQTGHSNGAATDDERKVLANTLFYLKQLTNDTQAADKSAYDMQAPVISGTGGVTVSEGKLSVSINAEDYGTHYRYYVEAVPQGEVTDVWKRQSDIVETTVASGLEGYLVLISDSENAVTDMEGLDMICPENGIISCEMPETEEGKQYYLHIRAVDYAGNISEETVLPVPEEEKEQPGIFDTGYGLFGMEDVTAYIQELTVEQNVYSGGNLTCAGSGIIIHGNATAAGQMNLYTGSRSITEQTEYAEAKEMPQLHEGILASMGGQESLEILNVYESTRIDTPTWCMTTTGAYCPELILNASLMCDNTISIGAGSITCGQEENVVLYSVNGDININTSILNGRGLIYAPNGTVTVNVQNMEFAGSIIARRIVIQGSMIQIGQEKINEEQ